MKFYREKFREIRKNLRWTTIALANATSRQSISFWENGKKVPSEKKVRLLAQTLDVRVSEISDLPDSHPVSEQNISETIESNNIHDSTDSNTIKTYVDTILLNLNKIDNKLSETSLILDALLNYSNNIIYIKDTNQSFVIANKAFLENLNLKPEFNVKGKKDEDFFSKKEASLNLKQDHEVILSGKPLLKHEQTIPGTRNQRWGIISKIPILDREKKIRGLLSITVDITERKKEEQRRRILEYAISKVDGAIWVAKGINPNPGLPFYKEPIYTSGKYINSDSNKQFFGDINPNDMTNEEHLKFWIDSLPKDSLEKLMDFKNNMRFPISRSYRVISPITKKEFWINENIYADENNEIFVGHVFFSKEIIKSRLIKKAIDAIPKLIIWTGEPVESENRYNYSSMSNPESITGYNKSYYMEQKHYLTEHITDERLKEMILNKIRNEEFPFYTIFPIKAKNGKEKLIESHYFKIQEENDYTPTYYGFFLDVT